MVSLRISFSWCMVLFSGLIYVNCSFEEYYKWKQIVYEPIIEESVKDLNRYNNIPVGASRYKNRIILALPRRDLLGIGSTLNYVDADEPIGSSPILKGFPTAEMNIMHDDLHADPNKIISVYRTFVDECKRLWWIDTGMIEYPYSTPNQVQRPSIWAYDLENDQVVHRFEIPTSIVERGKGMASITVDADPNDCENAYGYIPDLNEKRMYVYSLQKDKIWKLKHNYFGFDPLYGIFEVNGLQFMWDDSIFSIVLGKRQPDGYRTAYFHSLASISEFAVSTEVLQNEGNSGKIYYGSDFQHLGYRGPKHESGTHEIDPNTGIIFYSQVHLNGIGCWNTNTQHAPYNFHILAEDNETMIYQSDVTIDDEGYLWVLTDRMPIVAYGQIDTNEYNFRLLRASIKDLIKDSPCSITRSGKYVG